jgi:phosphoribosylamine---glycine ligase
VTSISGLDGVDAPDLKVFHAGTRLEDGAVVTAGGRVLCVVGLGTMWPRPSAALTQGVARSTGTTFFRRDIGHRAWPD